jgi:hypothetical protein
MRSGVLIGAAIAVLTARLVAGNGDDPPADPVAARAAGAAAALLEGAAAASPPTAHPAVRPSPVAGPAASVPAHLPVERAASGSQALRAASVEAEVQLRRARGEGEDAVYRARAAQLPAADVAHLMAAEAAEAEWQRQLASTPRDCAAPCNGEAQDHALAATPRRDLLPRLTLE